MSFFRFFRNRRPGAAAVIGLLLGPAIVMAYLGRGRLAILYLVLGNLLFFPVLAFSQLTPIQGAGITTICLNVVGCIHGYRMARAGLIGTRQPWFSRWYNTAFFFWFLPIGFALVLRTFVVQPFTIPSGSMMPTLTPGDYAFVTKFNYGYSRYSFPFRPGWIAPKLFGAKPARGDVVVLADPPNPAIDYAKRVIGLPGDRVQMKEGILFINGQAVPRDAEGTITSTYDQQPGEYPVFGELLDNGVHYRTLDIAAHSRGDNTREFVVPDGSYFVLGDNRDNSIDSRFDVGFVPEANIYGKFWLVFHRDSGGSGWSFVR